MPRSISYEILWPDMESTAKNLLWEFNKAAYTTHKLKIAGKWKRVKVFSEELPESPPS